MLVAGHLKEEATTKAYRDQWHVAGQLEVYKLSITAVAATKEAIASGIILTKNKLA